MAILYLHAGHSKTGTSWLQAALRENAAALAENGLSYPLFFGFGAESGAEIGQGNGLPLAMLESREKLRASLELIDRSTCPAGAVFSSEEFFPRLSEYEDPAMLPRAARDAGFDRVEILLFIRDPVGHAASLWQQYLKRGGGFAPVEAFFEKYAVPNRVARFFERFARLAGVELTCLNYDRHSQDLLTPLQAWLGLPPEALTPPSAPVVNRGMTRAELRLQAALNRRVGRVGRFLSDALCTELPNVAPDPIRPDTAIQRAMVERLAPALARVNGFLPRNERYRQDIAPAPADSDRAPLGFSSEQLDLIGDALGSEIRRLRVELAEMRDMPRPRN